MANEAERKEPANETEVYKRYQENIRLSETLQHEMLLGTRRGDDACALLLKAAQVISNMVGDNGAFAREITANVQAVYGLGFGEKTPIETQLEAAKTRLQNLMATEAQLGMGEDKKRMKTAIKEHQDLIAMLEERLKNQ